MKETYIEAVSKRDPTLRISGKVFDKILGGYAVDTEVGRRFVTYDMFDIKEIKL